ncbi:MAG: AAA family ATPase [Patescibacteria group bacterium]|jgi:predicted kinase
MKQLFIMLIGFSRSGKTTLAKKIIENIKDLVLIDSDSIHLFLNNTYPLFQDNDTIEGQSYEIRQKTTKAIQEALISTLLKDGHSILLDANNGKKEVRETILKTVKNINPEIQTILLRHKIDEKILYKNIKKADQIKGGYTWKDLYEKIQKPNFDEATKDETNYLLIHTNNTADIINEIKNISTKHRV